MDHLADIQLECNQRDLILFSLNQKVGLLFLTDMHITWVKLVRWLKVLTQSRMAVQGHESTTGRAINWLSGKSTICAARPSCLEDQ
jgi:hypothetical protein